MKLLTVQIYRLSYSLIGLKLIMGNCSPKGRRRALFWALLQFSTPTQFSNSSGTNKVGGTSEYLPLEQGRTSWKTLVWRNLNIGVAKWNIGVAKLSIRYNFNFRLPIGFCTLGRQTWHEIFLFSHSSRKFRKKFQKSSDFFETSKPILKFDYVDVSGIIELEIAYWKILEPLNLLFLFFIVVLKDNRNSKLAKNLFFGKEMVKIHHILIFRAKDLVNSLKTLQNF